MTAVPTPPSLGSGSADHYALHTDNISHNVTLPGEQHQKLDKADIGGIMGVFPPYMCSAIVKDNEPPSGTISMSFPDLPSLDCVMTLLIEANKVQYLAMALFGLHVESGSGLRYIVHPNGTLVVPIHGQGVYLQGAEEDGLISVLGSEITAAILASGLRGNELRNATRRTRCVTLEIKGDSDQPCVLNLWLELERGIQLKRKLYKQLIF